MKPITLLNCCLGLETSQAVIIAFGVMIHNYIELGGPCHIQHLQSIFLILPFLACTLALSYYNAYPSEVFVGDSFTYFAGMALAVVSIQSHFSKTLMLFFAPELINFILSLPQLFKIVPCPRHRLPMCVLFILTKTTSNIPLDTIERRIFSATAETLPLLILFYIFLGQ